MNQRRGLWMVVGLAVLCARSAFDEMPPGGTGCTKSVEVVTTAAQDTASDAQITEITPNGARICSVSLIAKAANAWARVFDSPETTNPSNGQAETVAEPGVATSFNSESQFFGELGRPAHNGLGVEVVKGRVIVHYQD